MSRTPGLNPACRLLAVVVAGVFFFDATARSQSGSGLSSFGRPPQLALVWATLGVLSLFLIGGARERLTCARRLSLLLLAVSLFGGRAVGAAPELPLALAAVTLLVAGPFVRFGLTGVSVTIILFCTAPAVLVAPFHQGALNWLTDFLPVAILASVLPGLFPGRHLRRAVLVFIVGMAVLAGAALVTYGTLADALQLPLPALFATRLRLMGMHPNLGAPFLVCGLLMSCGLAWDVHEIRRRWARACALLLLLALAAVQSRTGVAAAVLGAGLLVLRRLPWSSARWVHPLAVGGIAFALLFPVTGVSQSRIVDASTDMSTKAVSFRSSMWELGRSTFAEAPFAGFGPGASHRQAEFARPSRYDGLPKDDHLHNVVLAVGTGFGWPGLLGLAALFVATATRKHRPSLLSDAASASLLAVWASNAIDMGGATSTAYPSLVLLALGMKEAAGLADDETVTISRSRSLLTPVVAVVLLGVAAAGWSGRVLVEGVLESAAEEHPDPSGQLALAARLRPFDPEVAIARAQQAAISDGLDTQLMHLSEARALQPHSAQLMHREALLLSRLQPGSPEIGRLLAESVLKDGLGPNSWRVLLDQARVLGSQADADAALQALLQAIILNPSAVQGAVWHPSVDQLELGLGGAQSVRIPIARLLIALGKERQERGKNDQATRVRLQLREIEIFAALGEFARADEACERILADNDQYRHLRLGSSALAQHDYERALHEFAQIEGEHGYQTRVEELLALSEAPTLNVARVDALVAHLLNHLPDIVFESGSLRQTLHALRRVAERRKDPSEALRWADALQFASR